MDRICEVSGCTNLGRLRGDGKRYARCQRHLGHYDRQDRRNADRLLAGEQIRNRALHHRAVRVVLGLAPGQLTASRICGDDCPLGWEGYTYRKRLRIPYPLCHPSHYVAESMEDNLARKVTDEATPNGDEMSWDSGRGAVD